MSEENIATDYYNSFFLPYVKVIAGISPLFLFKKKSDKKNENFIAELKIFCLTSFTFNDRLKT